MSSTTATTSSMPAPTARGTVSWSGRRSKSMVVVVVGGSVVVVVLGAVTGTVSLPMAGSVVPPQLAATAMGATSRVVSAPGRPVGPDPRRAPPIRRFTIRTTVSIAAPPPGMLVCPAGPGDSTGLGAAGRGRCGAVPG